MVKAVTDLDDKNKKNISVAEASNVLEQLYEFIKDYHHLPVTLLFEQMEDKAPCLTFSYDGDDSGKYDYNVIGSYSADLPFSIFYKINGKSTNARLDAINTLNDIGVFCDNATVKHALPQLNNNNKSMKIEMLDNPRLVSEDKSRNQTFCASFVFTYRHTRVF